MSISSKIQDITNSRNRIRTKMIAANQATSTDKLSTLSTNLEIGTDTTDATATAADILAPKTAYAGGSKITGTMSIITSQEIDDIIDEIFTFRPKSFAEATDAEIAQYLTMHRNGDIDLTDYWSIGDTREVDISAMSAYEDLEDTHAAQTITLQIWHGPDIFDLSDGGKNVFVIGLAASLDDGKGVINNEATNAGGWKESERRPWCDEVFREALPESTKNLFKSFVYYGTSGGSSTQLDEMENYFTYPALTELISWEECEEDLPGYTANESNQFDYFAEDYENRCLKVGTTSTGANYLLRSPYLIGGTNFNFINNNGYIRSNTNAANANYPHDIVLFGCI